MMLLWLWWLAWARWFGLLTGAAPVVARRHPEPLRGYELEWVADDECYRIVEADEA